jgi:hypothetical protein
MSTEAALPAAAGGVPEEPPVAASDSALERLVNESADAPALEPLVKESPEGPPLERPGTPLELLLARPEQLMRQIHEGRDLGSLVRIALLTILLGTAIFGATVGAYRGGIQMLYAALKLPLVLLLTTAACAPALTAVATGLGRQSDPRRDIALVLSSLARTSLTFAALTPLLLLAIRRDSEYHNLVLLLVATSATAGAVGIWFFLRGLRALDTTATWTTALVVSAVFMLVGVQMSWTLRPYLVRPRDTDVVFVRSIEGSFVEAVQTAARSAAGIYPNEADVRGEY